LYELFQETALEMSDLLPVRDFSPKERQTLVRMLVTGLNTPATSSVGRLFDGVASLVGIRQRAGYEGQAAAALEALVPGSNEETPYPVELMPPADESDTQAIASAVRPLWWIDWRPMLRSILKDIRGNEEPGRMADRFHGALVEAIVLVARRSGMDRVALGGGCFQNAVLLERAISRLSGEGIRCYWPQRIPPNDGGISFGQALVASWRGMSRLQPGSKSYY
jgi:hydrogenase maturation protein HypF